MCEGESCHWKHVWASGRGGRLADCHHRDGGVYGAGQELSSWDFCFDGRARSRRRRRTSVRDRHHLGSGPRLVLRAVQVLLVEAPLGQERLRRGER